VSIRGLLIHRCSVWQTAYGAADASGGFARTNDVESGAADEEDVLCRLNELSYADRRVLQSEQADARYALYLLPDAAVIRGNQIQLTSPNMPIETMQVEIVVLSSNRNLYKKAFLSGRRRRKPGGV